MARLLEIVAEERARSERLESDRLKRQTALVTTVLGLVVIVGIALRLKSDGDDTDGLRGKRVREKTVASGKSGRVTADPTPAQQSRAGGDSEQPGSDSPLAVIPPSAEQASELIRGDSALSTAYTLVMTVGRHLSDSVAVRLRNDERIWVSERDATCHFASARLGQNAVPDSATADCFIQAAKMRTRALHREAADLAIRK